MIKFGPHKIRTVRRRVRVFIMHKFNRITRKLQNSNTTSKDESLCNAIDNALNLLKEADLVL